MEESKIQEKQVEINIKKNFKINSIVRIKKGSRYYDNNNNIPSNTNGIVESWWTDSGSVKWKNGKVNILRYDDLELIKELILPINNDKITFELINNDNITLEGVYQINNKTGFGNAKIMSLANRPTGNCQICLIQYMSNLFKNENFPTKEHRLMFLKECYKLTGKSLLMIDIRSEYINDVESIWSKKEDILVKTIYINNTKAEMVLYLLQMKQFQQENYIDPNKDFIENELKTAKPIEIIANKENITQLVLDLQKEEVKKKRVIKKTPYVDYIYNSNYISYTDNNPF